MRPEGMSIKRRKEKIAPLRRREGERERERERERE